MKRFILTSILILLSIIGYGQKKISILASPTISWGNSVFVRDNTSFVDLREETTFLNSSSSYGLNLNLFWRDRYSYYQSRLYGFKVGVIRTRSIQSITYNPNLILADAITIKEINKFINIPILFTQSSTNHQILIYEVGTSLSYYENDRQWYGSFIGKIGLNAHISKELSYSILLSNTYIKLRNNSRYKLDNVIEFNLMYKITKR